MKLKVYIEEFLEIQKNEGFLNDASIRNYRSKLEIFYEFIYEYEKANDNVLDVYLNGLDINKIFESIDFYISTRGIKAEYSVRLYTSVLAEFLKFLFSTKNVIRNDNLINSLQTSKKMIDNSFFAKIDEYINKLLNEKILVFSVDNEPISDEEYIKLVEYCDEKLSIESISDLINYKNYNGQYSIYISSLMLKFILAFGFKVGVLYELNVDSINLNNNMFSFNGYTVYLPNKLSEQVRIYLGIRKTVITQNNSSVENLFVNYDGSRINTNSDINNRIKDIAKQASTTMVSRYIVMKMFEENIPRLIIEEFTGNGNKILDYCQYRVYELTSLNKDNYLRSKILLLESNIFL